MSLESYRVENIATMICSTVLVLGLWFGGAGLHSLWGLLLLLNLNYVKHTKP